MGLQDAERDIVSCNSDSNDASSSHTDAHRDGTQDAPGQHSPGSATDDPKSQKQSRKAPRPIPQLIPLNASTPNQKTSGEPPAKKFKESTSSELIGKFENLPEDITLIPVNVPAKETTVRKKNNSFFDKLKERLLTETGEEGSLKCKNCGFESKCLSEHSVHEKNCSTQANRITMSAALPTKGSTRCQNCRHRCKSSADLYVHMQTCGKKNNASGENVTDSKYNNEASTSQLEKEAEPHPMENVVFVWNNINQEGSKFDRPLDININDDSTITDLNRHYDTETVDENEGMNLSPNSLSLGKNVYKCPDCKFWAATASRFHVHIVGHLNKKPFECSLCKYKSNWRWDITKHIKLKSARDPEHNDAKVLMTDETGRRNYSKYNKFLAVPVLNENGDNEFHYIDPNTTVDASMEVDESYGNESTDMMHVSYEMQPLNLQTQPTDKYNIDNRNIDNKKPKKTLWKCKKCNYK